MPVIFPGIGVTVIEVICQISFLSLLGNGYSDSHLISLRKYAYLSGSESPRAGDRCSAGTWWVPPCGLSVPCNRSIGPEEKIAEAVQGPGVVQGLMVTGGS